METIAFQKFSGCGNDFIIIDNRSGHIDEHRLHQLVIGACRRKLSVGADGFILVENSEKADFRWRFFNADGSVAEMCGNGARCVARFAWLNGIAGPKLSFQTLAGLVSATVEGNLVRVRMPEARDLALDEPLQAADAVLSVSRIHTGVPHAVVFVNDLEDVDVVGLGRVIRHHAHYGPAGTNVNFVCCGADGSLSVRTYERGVENETLACGTGAVASAIVAGIRFGLRPPVAVTTRSTGVLTIHYRSESGRFLDIDMSGDARLVCRGEITTEAWDTPAVRPGGS